MGDRQGQAKTTEYPVLLARQRKSDKVREDLSALTRAWKIPQVMNKFRHYLRVHGNCQNDCPEPEEVAGCRAECFHSVSVPIQQFQGDGVEMHQLHWTGDAGFRKTGEVRADWVWVRRKEGCDGVNGELNGRSVGRLRGLFRIWDLM